MSAEELATLKAEATAFEEANGVDTRPRKGTRENYRKCVTHLERERLVK